MAVSSDLVHQTSTTTGTGTFVLVAVNGKRTLNTAFGTGGSNLFWYYISNRSAAEWERGTGHLSDATTLVRDTVSASSNSGAAVNFSAGTKDITSDIPYDQQMVLTTQGDVLYYGASALARLAAGTAGQKLITGGAGANPAWGATVKIGTFTYDLTTASGTQAITGVGFQPTAVFFVGGKNGSSGVGFGLDDGTNRIGVFDDNVDSAGTYVVTTSNSLAIATAAGANQQANITSFGADGFTLAWVKTGSPTGTATIGYLALR